MTDTPDRATLLAVADASEVARNACESFTRAAEWCAFPAALRAKAGD
jgi:hypothetical protein